LQVFHSFPPRRSSDLFSNDQQAPSMIRLLLFQPHSVYLSGMPVRDEFARLYRLVVRTTQIDLNRQLNQLSTRLKINAERLIFMLRVFSAAGFVDRKSTRLNSSHVSISYAVFCLKKKSTR